MPYANPADQKANAAKYRAEHKEQIKAKGVIYKKEHAAELKAKYMKYNAENKAKRKAWAVANKDKIKAYSDSHIEQTRVRTVEYNRTHKTHKFEIMLAYNYGMTQADWLAMEKAQHGLCAVCQKPPSGTKGNSKLHVDHDHETGEVRALLCHKCNNALGSFRDDAVTVQRAADYLKKFNAIKKCRLTGVCP